MTCLIYIKSDLLMTSHNWSRIFANKVHDSHEFLVDGITKHSNTSACK